MSTNAVMLNDENALTGNAGSDAMHVYLIVAVGCASDEEKSAAGRSSRITCKNM